MIGRQSIPDHGDVREGAPSENGSRGPPVIVSLKSQRDDKRQCAKVIRVHAPRVYLAHKVTHGFYSRCRGAFCGALLAPPSCPMTPLFSSAAPANNPWAVIWCKSRVAARFIATLSGGKPRTIKFRESISTDRCQSRHRGYGQEMWQRRYRRRRALVSSQPSENAVSDRGLCGSATAGRRDAVHYDLLIYAYAGI